MGGQKTDKNLFNSIADQHGNGDALAELRNKLPENNQEKSLENEFGADAEKTPIIVSEDVADVFFNEQVLNNYKKRYKEAQRIFDRERAIFEDRLEKELNKKEIAAGNLQEEIWRILRNQDSIKGAFREEMEKWYQENSDNIQIPIQEEGDEATDAADGKNRSEHSGKTENLGEKKLKTETRNPKSSEEITMPKTDESNMEKSPQWPSFTKFKKTYSVYEDKFFDKSGKKRKGIISPMFIEKNGGREMRIIGYDAKTGTVTVEFFDFYEKKGEEVVFNKPIKKSIKKIDFKKFEGLMEEFELDKDDDLEDKWEGFGEEAIEAMKKVELTEDGNINKEDDQVKKASNKKLNKKMKEMNTGNINKKEALSDKDLELRKKEIYQEGADYVEEHVGEGEFEYRITPNKEKTKIKEDKKEEAKGVELDGEDEEAMLNERVAIKQGRDAREDYLKEENRKKRRNEEAGLGGEGEEPILREREESIKTENRDEGLKTEDWNLDLVTLKNQGIFEKTSHKGRDIVSNIYQDVFRNKFFDSGRIVGKVHAAYHDFWLKRNEKKGAKLKSKMDVIEMKEKSLGEAKNKLESTIEKLQNQGIPGADSLQPKIKKIESQIVKSKSKKDRIQTKFEARGNKYKLYANKRDGIADKLIDKYDQRLRPFEQQLEGLNSYRKKLDLVEESMESRHNKEREELNSIEERKKEIQDGFRGLGWSEERINRFEAVKTLNKLISEGERRIAKDKKFIDKIRVKNDKEIARIDKRANPFRDRKEEFVKIKGRRPIDIKTEDRKRTKNNKTREQVSTHGNNNFESKEKAFSSVKIFVESYNDLVKKRNKELERQSRKSEKPVMTYRKVDVNDFIRNTNFRSRDEVVGENGFREALRNYLKKH